MSDEHSLLSASSAERWLKCPISLTATASSDTNEAAAEGTMLHAICEGALTGGAYPKVGSKHHFDGYDFEFTADRLSDCEAYVDFVRAMPWSGSFSVETRVYYSKALAVPRNLAYGTADCRGFTESADGRILEIVDLKMGCKPVNPTNNPQAILYAAGVLEELSEVLVLPPTHLVRVTIYQPRLSRKPFQWLTTVGHIEQSYRAMRPAAQAGVRFKLGTATDMDAQQFPEMFGKHCGYCKRKAACAEYKRQIVKAVPTPGQTVQWDENLFRARAIIRAHLDDLEQLALDSAMAGNNLPGSKLVKGKAGHAKLKASEDLVRKTAIHLGIEKMVVETKEVWATPAKIRDAFKRVGMTPVQIAQFIEQPEGKPQVADADDPRETYQTGIGNSFTGVAQA